MATQPPSPGGRQKRDSSRGRGSSNLLLMAITLSIFIIASLNYLQFQPQKVTSSQTHHFDDRGNGGPKIVKALQQELNDALVESKRKDEQIAALKAQLEARDHTEPVDAKQTLTKSPNPVSNSTHIIKSSSINSFWWPSIHSGLLGKLYRAQNPTDCDAPGTKYFVWRSRKNHEEDTRGLTAWGHAAKSHLMHALTDGDQFQVSGSRVLIQDDKLWPMAKGCEHGPETRDCYFEPLTRCPLSSVDPIDSKNKLAVHVLSDFKEEYDRKVRTLYSTTKLWFRTTDDAYSWTGLPGGQKAHSEISMNAAAFAYYFNPKPWLRDEIDKRLRKSIPPDLDPDKTIGVPIRRSDKCKGHKLTGSARGEMKCHPLETYMDGVKSFLDFDPSIENVIVTSEDKGACDEFVRLLKKEFPTIRVIVNVGDVQQGTGSGSKLENYKEGATNAAVVASALTSMHLHMRARYFVITSMSTWTSTIALMARVYGFAASDVFVIDIESNVNGFAKLVETGCPHTRNGYS